LFRYTALSFPAGSAGAVHQVHDRLMPLTQLRIVQQVDNADKKLFARFISHALSP
jgi:hypothetical protein